MTTVGAGSPPCTVMVRKHSLTAFKWECVCNLQMAKCCRAHVKEQQGHQDIMVAAGL